MMYHRANFGLLIVSGLRVIYKNIFANLCKPIDVIIIPIYDFRSKSEKIGEGRAEIRNLAYLQNEKSFLHEKKTIFHHCIRAFF